METLIMKALSAYAVTFMVASSSIAGGLREKIKKHTPRLKIGNHPHFVECRMCVGFWIAIAICNTDWTMILPTYGLAYFMATQER